RTAPSRSSSQLPDDLAIAPFGLTWFAPLFRAHTGWGVSPRRPLGGREVSTARPGCGAGVFPAPPPDGLVSHLVGILPPCTIRRTPPPPRPHTWPSHCGDGVRSWPRPRVPASGRGRWCTL